LSTINMQILPNVTHFSASLVQDIFLLGHYLRLRACETFSAFTFLESC
jgi:hypothetical protein